MPLWIQRWRILQRRALQINIVIMNQIENIIHAALNVGENNEIRTQAEARIYQLAKENYTDFFLTLANIISDQGKDKRTRQTTATVLKRLLSFVDEQSVFFWDRVNMNSKLAIKEMLLSTLISSDSIIVKAGANAIAQIASIEIPRNEWLDIVNTLAQNTQHQDYNIRRASVITLGFICQELRNSKSTIDNESCKQILGSLLLGLQKEGEIVEVSLAAIRDSVQFLRNILQNVDYCNKTFEYLTPLLDNPDARPKVYEILFQFCKHCYHLVNHYLAFIVKFTIAHMQLRNEDSISALTLWETLGSEYLERRAELQDRVDFNNQQGLPNYFMMASHEILNQMMSLMIITSKNDVEFADLRESAVQTLTTVVQCSDISIVESISEGVATILQSSNPGERQATVLLFGCLCNYQDRFEVETRFARAFNFFYKLLQDNDITVVKNTLNGFVTLSEFFPEVWLNNQEIKDIFLHLLSMSKNNDEVIKLLSLSILANITEELSRHPEPIATDPKAYLTELVGMFLQSIENASNKDSTEKVIIIIMNIIISTRNIPIVNELISHLISQYHHFSRLHIADKNIVLEQLISLIHTCLLAISKSSMPKPQLKDQVFDLIDQHIRVYGVEPEGINMISAASGCFKKDFKDRIGNYWDNIMHALGQVDQKPLFKTTLTCISDIARNHEQHVADKIIKVFNILVEYMQKNIDRDLKTEILKCFGDLALGLKRNTQRFLDTLLEICANCFEAVYTFSEQESEKAYAEELKQSLIEMYHCMVFAVNDQNNCNNKMAAHFPLICTFIVKSCDVKYKPTVDYLKSCLFMVFDCALFYSTSREHKSQVQNIINTPEINKLIDNVRKFQDRPDVKELLLFIEDKIRLGRA